MVKVFCIIGPLEAERNVFKKYDKCFWVFFCVEVLWSSQPNGVMSSAVSLPNHTFTGQA